MSVRDGVLAILTLGPAYGLQLHSELALRSPHRAGVNPGQIYATLDRLTRAGLIESGGTTDDGLPLHRLTVSGHSAAARWLSEPLAGSVPDWSEMLDQILVGSTLDTVVTRRLVREYRVRWSAERDAAGPMAGDSPVAELSAAARSAQARAALDWLDTVTAPLAEGTTVRGLSPARPRRGRRRHGTTSAG